MLNKPTNAEGAPDLNEEAAPVWRDSSLELERGLEVIELHVDVVLPLDPPLF